MQPINRDLLHIPYWYAVWGTLFMALPTFIALYKHPNLFGDFYKVASYFFFHGLIFEVTALKLGWWNFDGGQFIGMLQLLGAVMPFEEFMTWFVFAATGFMGYYTLFDKVK